MSSYLTKLSLQWEKETLKQWVWAVVEHRREGQLSGHRCADSVNEKEQIWEKLEAEGEQPEMGKRLQDLKGMSVAGMQWAAGSGEMVGLERKAGTEDYIKLLNSIESH